MATFSVDGLGDFMLSMQQVAELPGEVIDEILEAGSEVVIKAQKDELLTLGLYDNESSGPHLVDSIKLHKKLHAASAGGPSRYVLIYPTGKHGQYNRRLRTKAYKNSKHGRTYTVGGDQKATSSSEVGFIHEYGAPRRNIPAKRWMQNANEKSAAATTAAQAAVYNKFLESKTCKGGHTICLSMARKCSSGRRSPRQIPNRRTACPTTARR